MVRLLASGGLPKKRSEEEKVVKKRREQQQEVSAMRLRVAALMTEALAIDSSDRELCEEIGAQIEAALTEQLGDSPPKYATQTRSIKFNLSKNAQLRERVLSGELTPQQYGTNSLFSGANFADWLCWTHGIWLTNLSLTSAM